MPSENTLRLWWSEETRTVFVYYLTGAMVFSFVITVFITRSLRRKEARVLHLMHLDNIKEYLVPYMIIVKTSLMPGCGLPKQAKVFLQFLGDKGPSQNFELRSNKGGRTQFQRGFTDIFLVKVPESTGDIHSARFVVAGLTSPLPWRVLSVHLYKPETGERRHLPATVTTVEVLDTRYSQSIIHRQSCTCCGSCLCKYHQWTAMFSNTVRLGAFTEIVHVFMVFVALFSLLLATLMYYITLPRGNVKVIDIYTLEITLETLDNIEDLLDTEQFDLKIESLIRASCYSACYCSLGLLVLELILRSVRSWESTPGPGYHSIRNGSNRNNSSRPMALESLIAETFSQNWTVLRKEHLNDANFNLVTGNGSVHQVSNYVRDLVVMCKRLYDLIQIGMEKADTAIKAEQEIIRLEEEYYRLEQERIRLEQERIRLEEERKRMEEQIEAERITREEQVRLMSECKMQCLVEQQNEARRFLIEQEAREKPLREQRARERELREQQRLLELERQRKAEELRLAEQAARKAEAEAERAMAAVREKTSTEIDMPVELNTTSSGDLTTLIDLTPFTQNEEKICETLLFFDCENSDQEEGEDLGYEIEENMNRLKSLQGKKGNSSHLLKKNQSFDEVLIDIPEFMPEKDGEDGFNSWKEGASARLELRRDWFAESDTNLDIPGSQTFEDSSKNKPSTSKAPFSKDDKNNSAFEEKGKPCGNEKRCNLNLSANALGPGGSDESEKEVSKKPFLQQSEVSYRTRKMQQSEASSQKSELTLKSSECVSAVSLNNSETYYSCASLPQSDNVGLSGTDADMLGELEASMLGTGQHYQVEDGIGGGPGTYQCDTIDPSGVDVDVLGELEAGMLGTGKHYQVKDSGPGTPQKNNTDSFRCEKLEKMSKKERLEHWQSSQKQWARMFVKDIYLLFERTRSKLVNLRLLSGDVIQDLMVLSSKMLERVQAAVAVQLFDHRKSTVHLEDLHELRISMLALHLSIEAVTLCVKDTAHTLVYSAPSLADLVLQSHHVVLAVEHAADTFVYFIQEKCPNAHLLCALDVDRAPYILHMEFLKCCYCLVTKYDLVSWNDLRVFTTTNLLPCFNVETLDEFHRFIRKGLASQSALRLTVNRLCTLVECVAKQEVWAEMNNAKFVFTEMLVKQKLLDMLRGKILEITRKKKKFDKMHDLLPKEPLTRIQKLILKRKKAPAVEMGGGDNTNEPGVTYQPEDGVIQSQREKELIEILIDKIAQLVPGGGDMCEAKDPKAALLQESEDMGRQKVTLQVLYDRLCSKYRRDGIDPEMDAARCLSQAVLLPCVALTREEANSTNKFYFENFLHLKFVENLLTEFYSLTGHDLADYMFTSIATDIKDLDASSPLLAIVVQDIVIRIDHVTLILLEDVEDWVRNAVRMGPTKMSALRKLAKQSSINIMRRSTSVMNWSGIHLGTATRSEMLELQAGLDEDNTLLNASDFLTKQSDHHFGAQQSSIYIIKSVMNWSGVHLGKATRSEMQELQAGLEEDDIPVNVSDYLIEQTSRPTLDLPTEQAPSTTQSIQTSRPVSGLQSATKSQSQGLQSTTKSQSQGLQSTTKSQSQGLQSTTKSQSQGLQSTTKSQSQGLQSTTKSQSQGLQSTTKSQSQGLQSTTKSQSQGLQSTTKSQSQGLQSTTKSQSQGLQSTTESQSQVLQSATKSQSQGLQSATESQSQGLQSATESQSQGLRSTTESQSQGLQSTTESQSQGLRSTTKSQLQGVQSTTKSHSQGLQSTTESQPQGLQSTTKSQSQGLQSTTKSQSQGLQSTTQSQGLQSTTKSHSQGLQSTTESQSQGLQSTTKSQSQGLQSTTKSQSQGLQSTTKSQSQGLQSITKSQSQGLQSTTKSQSQGLQSTTKSQSQGLQSTTKSQSQVMLVSESVQEADIGLKIGMLDEVQKINSFTDIINDVPMSASVAEADTTPNIGMQDEVKINSFTDIINELSPLKKYMVFVKNEEIMHSVATQGCYIQRRLEELNYIHQVHISNIMDSYYMLEEGDDSQTLTRAGLYQLEHDCTGEARKPLRGFVKSLILLLLFAWIVLCTVYVTVIGAQLGDKELQEWMCYYLASLLEFALVLEPLRAVLVSLYVKSLHWKLWRECNCCR